MHELEELIKKATREELQRIEEALNKGAIERLIKQRKQQLIGGKICPVCNSEVGDEALTLHFGPKGLRKQASFDATDCLQFFLNNINKNPKNNHATHRLEKNL
ncbi:hypothetical protein D6783_03135 [Candidatus Woesearchaeota archaeon]|nr:MAG: hypothetical protein D6783_03135 [Candidatus Woesearchaeota archaeon]